MKILLLQTSFLGDTILSTSVIESLANLYPNAELWLMTTPQARELVRRDPLVRGVITFDKRGKAKGLRGIWTVARKLRSMNFDKVYSLHRSFRTSLLLLLAGIPQRIGFREAKASFIYHKKAGRSAYPHDVLRNLAILSFERPIEISTSLRLFAPPLGELSSKVRTTMKALDDYVVLVPGSAWNTKMWKWEGYQEVAQHLINNRTTVVLLGSPAEASISEKIAEGLELVNLAGKTTISDAMYIIEHAKAVVCNDSMALHMASAFKVPTVAIFCATSPRYGFGPWQNEAVIVEKEGLDCKPCRRHGSQKCPTGTEACMQDLEAKQVIEALRSLMDA